MFYLCYGGPANLGTTGTPVASQQTNNTFSPAVQPKAWANPVLNSGQSYQLQNYENQADSGRGLNLAGSLCMEVMQFDTVDREFVMSGDGTQYHYTRWTIGASLYVNPERNDFSFFQGAGLPSITESDITIRNFLKQPRRRLTLIFDTSLETTASATAAYQVLVDVPQAGYSQDHEEGPVPLKCDVKSWAGSSGYVVQFAVRFATDDAQNRLFFPNSNPNTFFVPLLLSNRWNMRHSTDDKGYLVRSIEGTAVGNVPELRRRGLMIDQLSSMILPPPYPGMRRQVDRNATSEGSTLIYSIVDTQEPMTYIDDVLDLPSSLQTVVDETRGSTKGAFNGVYFEGPDDVNVLRGHMQQTYPISTYSVAKDSPLAPAAVSPPYSSGKQQSDLWFYGYRRQIASLSVRHTMRLAKEVSDATALEAGIQAGLQGISDIVTAARDDVRDTQDTRKGPNGNRQPKPRRFLARGSAIASSLRSAAGSTFSIFKALDSLVPRFYETVEVIAECRPEGNMKRAFFLALSTAYGLANNNQTGSPNPFDITVQFDYSQKTISVTIGYQAIDYTTMDRRQSGPRKIMVGPQSYLIGGSLDATIRSDIANAYETTPTFLVGQGAISPTWGGAVNSFQNGQFAALFPGDTNAKIILEQLAKDDLPDKNTLIMMDSSQYGQFFPTFGPNGDQVSRTFIECFVPLFTAPLVQLGEYPVMMGRPMYPHNANPTGTMGRSSDMSNFYNRKQELMGDSQLEMDSQSSAVKPVTWVNRAF